MDTTTFLKQKTTQLIEEYLVKSAQLEQLKREAEAVVVEPQLKKIAKILGLDNLSIGRSQTDLSNLEDTILSLKTKIDEIREQGVFDIDSIFDEVESAIETSLCDEEQVSSVEELYRIYESCTTQTLPALEYFHLLKSLWLRSVPSVRIHIQSTLMQSRVDDCLMESLITIENAITASRYKEAWDTIKLLFPVRKEKWPGLFKITKTGYRPANRPNFDGTIWEYISQLTSTMKANFHHSNEDINNDQL